MDGELGDFLRSRRARIRPEEVGLPSYGRRRVPGLRREEVAQLAGVSVDYYVRLEQGRGPGDPGRTRSGGVSDAVLDAIARVLRLNEAEHAYLRAVARPRRQDGPGASASRVRPGVRLLLDGMDRNPAYVLDHRMEVLAWNALADAVLGFSGPATSACRAGPSSTPPRVSSIRTGPRSPPRRSRTSVCRRATIPGTPSRGNSSPDSPGPARSSGVCGPIIWSSPATTV
ncbi:hypothetical protein SUDANB1_04846 [Streptomyces sp. enrichment culture]